MANSTGRIGAVSKSCASFPTTRFSRDDVTTAEWEDSLFGSIGLEYQPDDQWTLRAGAGIDASPIPDATRNPRIPDADRTWVSIGFTVQATKSISISASYAHLFLPDEPIALNPGQTGNALRGNIIGIGRSGRQLLRPAAELPHELSTSAP